jgi:hypothetical protein
VRDPVPLPDEWNHGGRAQRADGRGSNGRPECRAPAAGV